MTRLTKIQDLGATTKGETAGIYLEMAKAIAGRDTSQNVGV
jgi:hypothetical protein